MPISLELRLHRGLPATLRLGRELPGGGMARVFLADDQTLGRRVVVKVLAPELVEGLSNERFKREIHLAAQLQHPHLVPVLQAGEAEGLPYFIMPYVAGESLRVRLGDGQPLPVRETVAVLRDVARAMAYAHGQGIIHRDIKPDNVLLSGGSAMVSDFGIAKALSSALATDPDSTVLTRTGSSLGTPTYMAPEQSAADPSADHRVDIYAFGVMAYELLTGRPPFHGRSPQALLTAHLVEAPVPLADRVPGLPSELNALVLECLEKDPARRPGSADAILERLDRIDWSGERAAAIRLGAGMRGRSAWIAGGVVALILAAAAVTIWRVEGRAGAIRDPRLVAVVPFRVASADPALHYLREGMLDLLSAKLPGEGGLQATEPRIVLDAWHSAGGDPQHDLSTPDANLLAGRLGAGWLLLGDVVGTPSRVTLNAALIPTGASQASTRVSVDGPPDSLGSLVDQLVARLLTSVAQGTPQGPSLNRASLPVLRAYLDGVSKLRNGLASSVGAFAEALDRDTTFAPSALGLVQAMGWFSGSSAAQRRALNIAWVGRQQLSLKDQALLSTIAGPRYPAESSTRETFEAAQRYLQLAPDRADAWYTYGDKIYHFGNALGIPDRAAKSAEAFRRAVAVDSTYVPGYIHLQQLAAELDDTLLDQRLMRLRTAIDTTRFWVDQQHWYRAVAGHDTAAMDAILTSQAVGNQGMLFTIARMPLFVPEAGPGPALVAYDSLIAQSATPGNLQANLGAASALLLLAGRPAAARVMLERIPPEGRLYVLGRQVMDAVMDAGDSTRAAEAVRQLERIATAATPRDSARAVEQQVAMRAVLAWRLTRADTVGARELLARLRAALPPAAASATPTMDAISVATFEALLAERQGRPEAARQAARLDTLLANYDFANGSNARLELANLVTARLLEKYQSPAAALGAMRRRATWWSNEMPYLAVQLREEGRLAALTGARDEAILSYRHYLTLRSHPEPVVAEEVARVRKELARLEVGDSR